MKDKKKKALELYGLGLSIRKIAEFLGVGKSTIHRWIAEMTDPKTQNFKSIPEDLTNRIKEMLMHVVEEKGRTRALSLSKIYELNEIDLFQCGMTKTMFYRWIKEFIKNEFGSWEKLEKKRRPRKEHSKFHIPKGKLNREEGTWEIDATGYSYKGKTYFILACRERWSGCFLSVMVTDVKEGTGASHYNKAFNALDVAKFLISLLNTHGVPKAIITDNEHILTADIITRGCAQLGIPIKKTRYYSPNQKLIERAFRDLKDLLRYYVSTHENFEDALKSAIETYNRTAHKFEHFSQPVIPLEIHQAVQYRESPGIDIIRKAFREKFIRTVRNNTIQIENLIYEFYYPYERYGEVGRKPKAPKVVCYRDIENIVQLEVWDEKEKLGIAQLISQDVPSLEPVELKEIKNKELRIERRKRKLQTELAKLQLEEHHQDTLSVFEIFSNFEENKGKENKEDDQKENDLDPIKIFLGGES